MKEALLAETPDAPLSFSETQRILREQQQALLAKYRTRYAAPLDWPNQAS